MAVPYIKPYLGQHRRARSGGRRRWPRHRARAIYQARGWSGQNAPGFKPRCWAPQAREERRAAQAAAAQGARILLRKETEWMARQPKARGTKAAARVRAFAELTSRARDVPQGDTRVTFGGAGMQRQACGPCLLRCNLRGSEGHFACKGREVQARCARRASCQFQQALP